MESEANYGIIDQKCGKLIVIDGLDGSGKQTQTALLLKRLKNDGIQVRAVSFPDYAQSSSSLVKSYLAGEFGVADEVSPYAASSFYAADRYVSYNRFWKEDYINGKLIIADRYATSNLIHQMSKLPKSQWDEFAKWVEDYEYIKLGLPRPDAVIFLDMPQKVSNDLISKRYCGDDEKRDIHEADTAYMERCRKCAVYAAKHFNWEIIPCSDGENPYLAEEIADNIYKRIKNEREIYAEISPY